MNEWCEMAIADSLVRGSCDISSNHVIISLQLAGKSLEDVVETQCCVENLEEFHCSANGYLHYFIFVVF